MEAILLDDGQTEEFIIMNLMLMPTKPRHPGSIYNQRTNGPVNANLISWPSKAQNIQNLEKIW